MIFRPGTYLQNRYEIIELIGTGGMSEVYKAKCHKLNRLVAIKVLKEEFCADQNFVKKFKMEAQSAAGLSHPNIVSVYDVVDEGQYHYIVMELIEGVTLKSYIATKGHLDIREATGIAIQVAQGISAAHQRHIIHRDIKPQNIILNNDGKVKVADFGIARAVSSQTLTSTAMGSVHYISPEQAKGEFTDERSDIYSLGITLYEMVTGKLPFQGDSTVSVALAHLEEAMTPPSVYNPEIPPSLEKIIMKCTEKDASNRYQDVLSVIADLRKSLVDPDGDSADGAETEPDGSTRILNKHEMNEIRAVAGKKKKAAVPEDEDRNGHSRLSSLVVGVGITLAILVAAGVLFLLLKFSGILGGKTATETGAAKTSAAAAAESSSLSDKQTYVPYVIGLSQNDAEKKLKESNLQIQVSGNGYSDQFDKDLVMEQSPAAGAVSDKYSKITVKISLGSDKVDLTTMKLTGMDSSAVQTALQAKGLVPQITEVFSDTVDIGKVVSVSPDKPAKGDTVQVTVSKGKEVKKVTVPDITGVSEEEAIGKLTDAGLKPGKAKTASSTTIAKGLVMAQGETAGSEIDSGTAVSYTVSSGVPESTSAAIPTVESPGTGSGNTGNYSYVASIDNTYKLSDLIGPGSNTTSFQVMIRLRQNVNGQTAYKTLMEPRNVTGDTILPVRFKSIEGAYGVDTGYVEVVRTDTNTVLQSYEVQFFKVQ